LDFDRYQKLVLTTYNAHERMRLVGVSNLQDLVGPTAPVAPGENSVTFDGNVTATDARTIRVRAKAAGKSVYSSVTVAP
jgi:hypothetical protein